MKAIFTWLLAAILITITLNSEAQSWQWGKRGGSNGSGSGADADEKVTDMATDQHGNVYVVAINNPYGMANVDGHMGISTWDRITIASWKCNGEFRWMKSFGSGSDARGIALGTDTLGGVYIIGGMSSHSSSLGGLGYFDTDTVIPSTNKYMYIIKYDTSGNFQWLKQPQPDTMTAISSSNIDMDVSPSGDIYLYSLLTPGLYDGGAFTVADTGMYVWKMNSNGVFQSLAKLDITVSGSPSDPTGYGNLTYSRFKRDHQSGKYYLNGFRSAFGTLTIGTTFIDRMMYVAAFDASGNVIWARQQDSSSVNGYIWNRPVIHNNTIFIGGSSSSGNGFGGYAIINELGPSVVPFIIALDTNGNTIWGTNGSAISGTIANGLVYTNNTINLAGRYGGLTWDGLSVSATPGKNYVFLARFNATTGAIIGLDSIAASSLNNGSSAMTADKNGNLYIGGSFQSKLYVGPDTLINIGPNYDWFVAKYGTASCGCTIPTAGFTYTTSGSTASFNYTGSTDYTSISWDFGDGTTAATPNPSHTFTDTGSHTVCVTVTNDCGSNLYCLEVAGPTGIESTANAAAVIVYPNPATQSITVEGASSGTTLSLFSITGPLQLEQTLKSSLPVSINISQLPDGVYLLQFTDSQGRKGMTKVVKQ